MQHMHGLRPTISLCPAASSRCCAYRCACVHRPYHREGEEGDNFYVIEAGDFVAVKGGRQVFRYEGSGSFGELALMYNCPRAATVQVSVLLESLHESNALELHATS